MMDFQGIPAFSSTESAAEKRKADAEARQAAAFRDRPADKPANLPITKATSPFPYQPPGMVARDYSTFQFQETRPTTMPNQSPLPQQQTLLNTTPVPFFSTALQTINVNLERIAAQIAGFFFGNRKEKPSDEEKAQRRLNDFFSLDVMGERKVEQAQQSGLGQGSK